MADHFEAKGVPLYAVLHETRGAVPFSKYFKGDLLFDKEKIFFGPEERRTLFMGMLRVGVWSNILRANKKNIEGNLKGDGSLLGGIFIFFNFKFL